MKKNFFLIISFLPLILGEVYYFSFSRIPGDMGDSRYVIFALEHGFRWMIGQDHSFWSASFFYPAKNVFAYQDNYLGSLPIYYLFRKFGNDAEKSYQDWILVSFFLNYLAAYVVLRMWSLSRTGTVCGAYFFTFGLPVMAQTSMHLQLIPRFAVPVAFYFLEKHLRNPRPFYLFMVLGALLWQIYLGIYTGYFLAVMLILLALIRWVDMNWSLERNEKIIVRLRSLLSYFKSQSWQFFFETKIREYFKYFAVCFLFFAGLLPLAIPYGEVAISNGGGYSWGMISSMLPRISSYFFAPTSILYGKLLTFGNDLPLPWEHQIFLGFLPMLAIVLFFIKKDMQYNPIVKMLFFELFILCCVIFALTLDIRGFSLYWIPAHLPVIDAIRGVTRISLVLLFPIGAILGFIVMSFQTIISQRIETIHFLKKEWKNAILALTSVLIVGLLFLDQMTTSLVAMEKSSVKHRIEDLRREVLAIDGDVVSNKNMILWDSGNGSDPMWVTQVDALLVSQRLNIKTINGYGSVIPPAYGDDLYGLYGNKCQAMQDWVSKNKLMFTGKVILIIGSSCKTHLLKSKTPYVTFMMAGS